MAASIQPSITTVGVHGRRYGVPGAVMLAMERESQLAVWTVNHTSKIDSNPGALTMSLVVIPGQAYVLPVPAEQKVGPTPRAELAAVDDTNQAPLTNRTWTETISGYSR